jgi:mannose-1-phosphate guanylyltransferase
MNNIYVAIMAGGIGSRFWPESRISKPKQFLDILDTGKTLLQMTFERAEKLTSQENIFVITADEYADLVKEQLPSIKNNQILKEPVRRNTAPCIAYVCDKIYNQNSEAVVVVVPSDHLILDNEKFIFHINECIAFANQNDSLITLGIKPTRPSSGYGYIQYEEEEFNGAFHKVKTFTEKPTEEIAKTFLKSGDFLWNSGMFVWKAKAILKALSEYLPEVSDCFIDGKKFYDTEKESEFISSAYSQCTNISIDYGVIEKAENVFTIPVQFGWSDVGTWGSLYEVYEKDYLGNAVKGQKVKIYDSSNNMVVVPKEKLVVIQGVSDLCIIDTDNVLLICQKSQEQEIKEITIDLKHGGLESFL